MKLYALIGRLVAAAAFDVLGYVSLRQEALLPTFIACAFALVIAGDTAIRLHRHLRA